MCQSGSPSWMMKFKTCQNANSERVKNQSKAMDKTHHSLEANSSARKLQEHIRTL